MKIIGITGKSGAGKTTFSDYLRTKEGIGVIHVDDLLKEIKLKYFKFLMKEDKNNEKTKVDPKFKKILYTNPFIFNAFMRFRAKLLEKPLKQKIYELGQTNHTVVIDDIFIKYHKVYKDMKTIFLLQRPYIERQVALFQRDGLSKEEAVVQDIAHYKGNYKMISKEKKITVISNKGDKEELEKTAEQIYEKELKRDRDNVKERYKTNKLIKIPLEKDLETNRNPNEMQKETEL